MLGGDDTHKFVCRSRFERNDLMANPGSRQIYLTFPADSIFSEEDVSNYFRLVDNSLVPTDRYMALQFFNAYDLPSSAFMF